MATHFRSLLENSMDRGAWQATVHGVANSLIPLCNTHFFHFHFQMLIKKQNIKDIHYQHLHIFRELLRRQSSVTKKNKQYKLYSGDWRFKVSIKTQDLDKFDSCNFPIIRIFRSEIFLLTLDLNIAKIL